jgi:hypothetical protein
VQLAARCPLVAGRWLLAAGCRLLAAHRLNMIWAPRLWQARWSWQHRFCRNVVPPIDVILVPLPPGSTCDMLPLAAGHNAARAVHKWQRAPCVAASYMRRCRQCGKYIWGSSGPAARVHDCGLQGARSGT